MQKIYKNIQRFFRTFRRIRYKLYQKLGIIGKHRAIEKTLMIFFWTILTALFLLLTFFTGREMNEEELPLNMNAVEQIHPEFEDVSVIPEKETYDLGIERLMNLEKQCSDGNAKIQKFTLQNKETIAALLSRAKIKVSNKETVVQTFEALIGSTKAKASEFHIFTDEASNFLGMALYDEKNTLAVLKSDDGSCLSLNQQAYVGDKTYQVTGKIERTFSGSAQKAGLPKSLVREIMNALDGEVDFYSDFHTGDSFEIIYETLATGGGLDIGGYKILYIGFEMGENQLHRYSYTDKSGITRFYTPKGSTGDKVLTKRPVKARTRLTSSFGNRRHPILKYTIFHHGVDLAAPMNTPIVAAGDGRILQIGRKGGYGKYIKIQHADGYQTAYGHLNGYRKGLKRGTAVKQGEVIGYVGNTGRSTGPHLHFEVLKGGKVVNPFSKHTIKGKQLSGFELEQFQSAAESIHEEFQRHLAGKIPPVPLEKPAEITTVKKTAPKKLR